MHSLPVFLPCEQTSRMSQSGRLPPSLAALNFLNMLPSSSQHPDQLVRPFLTPLRPGCCRLLCTNLETGAIASPSDAHWRSVLAQLGLTQAERAQLVECFAVYLRRRQAAAPEQAVLAEVRRRGGGCGKGIAMLLENGPFVQLEPPSCFRWPDSVGPARLQTSSS
jgi:hypothetical protein